MAANRSIGPVLVGILLGVAGTLWLSAGPRPVYAYNDRQGDYVICTGAVGVTARSMLEGIWILDHSKGKLLGSIVDRTMGKVVGFAEVDLYQEFGLGTHASPKFMMTTGLIAQSQAALYVAETTTGKIAVYTMGPTSDGSPGVNVLRNDISTFRRPN